MELPLYKEVRERQPVHDPKKPSGHTGLWFERFYNRFKKDFTDTKHNDNAFRDWLSDFNHLAGDGQLLDEAIQRQGLLVNSLQGQTAVFRCSWNFVSGMGNEHPLENGFHWHPVWGVPYLPGTGLKGLVRAWVEAWQFSDEDAEEVKQKQQRLLDWFGSVEKTPDVNAEPQTGKVIFFDALPLQPVRLSTDIMTPHMGEWYAKGGEIKDVTKDADKVPADWHSPNPIYFLSAKEPVFLFSIAPRNDTAMSEVDLSECMQAVADALEWLGAGAKTAVGYGQFERDDRGTEEYNLGILELIKLQARELENAEALQGVTGVALELIQYSQQQGWPDDKNAFVKPGELEDWLERLAEEPQAAAVEHLRGLFDTHFPGLLENPEQTKGKKKNPVFKPRQQNLAKSFLQIDKNLSKN